MQDIDHILDTLVHQLSINHKNELAEKNIFIEHLIAELHSTYATIDSLKLELKPDEIQYKGLIEDEIVNLN